MRPLGFELVDAVLDHVADAHDPAQHAVDHDRRVPHPALGHHAHDLVERDVRRDRVHVGRVDVRDRLGHHGGAPLGEGPDDVPLADDPADRGAVGGHDDGADSVLGEHIQQTAHLGVRGDGDYLRALTAQYISDTHLASLTPVRS